MTPYASATIEAEAKELHRRKCYSLGIRELHSQSRDRNMTESACTE